MTPHDRADDDHDPSKANAKLGWQAKTSVNQLVKMRLAAAQDTTRP